MSADEQHEHLNTHELVQASSLTLTSVNHQLSVHQKDTFPIILLVKRKYFILSLL